MELRFLILPTKWRIILGSHLNYRNLRNPEIIWHLINCFLWFLRSITTKAMWVLTETLALSSWRQSHSTPKLWASTMYKINQFFPSRDISFTILEKFKEHSISQTIFHTRTLKKPIKQKSNIPTKSAVTNLIAIFMWIKVHKNNKPNFYNKYWSSGVFCQENKRDINKSLKGWLLNIALRQLNYSRNAYLKNSTRNLALNLSLGEKHFPRKSSSS